MDTIYEPERQVPISGRYDAVIVGGGMAGVAAAVAAARNGVSVCLLEKACALGGLATLGNVTGWLPLCDGRGTQVSAGLAEELLKLSVADLRRDVPSARFKGIPSCWLADGNREERRTVRYRVDFNSSSYLLALEDLVLRANVRLLYDTRVCAVNRDGQRITHLIVENKSGRSAVECGCVVDASGDADICFLAGEETESLDSNVLCGWFYYLQDDGLHLKPLSARYAHGEKEGAAGPFFRGDDAEQVTDHITGTRKLIREWIGDLRAKLPGDNVQVIKPPAIACLRMTRRLVGAFSLAERHVHEWFDDSIGFTGDWRKAGPVYALPWRSLCAVRTRNLAVAGRCISVEKTAWDVTRAIPGCVVTGEAAGTAAALATRQCGGAVAALPVPALQDRLSQQGVILDSSLLAALRKRANDEP